MKAPAILALLALTACGGSSTLTTPTPTALPGGEGGMVHSSASASGSIVLYANSLVITVEGAHRDNFTLELWNKAVSGTERKGEPLWTVSPFGNGTFSFDASEFACYDLQVDVVSPGGGILASKQLAAWGPCATAPAPIPTPCPCGTVASPTEPGRCVKAQFDPVLSAQVARNVPTTCPSPRATPPPTECPRCFFLSNDRCLPDPNCTL